MKVAFRSHNPSRQPRSCCDPSPSTRTFASRTGWSPNASGQDFRSHWRMSSGQILGRGNDGRQLRHIAIQIRVVEPRRHGPFHQSIQSLSRDDHPGPRVDGTLDTDIERVIVPVSPTMVALPKYTGHSPRHLTAPYAAGEKPKKSSVSLPGPTATPHATISVRPIEPCRDGSGLRNQTPRLAETGPLTAVPQNEPYLTFSEKITKRRAGSRRSIRRIGRAFRKGARCEGCARLH